MNQDARRKNVSFGDAPVARIVRVPSLQDMSQAEITEKYYAKGDFGEFEGPGGSVKVVEVDDFRAYVSE